MRETGQQPSLRGRYISSIAATIISLACGTNYVYSAWAPQFAERLRLSATESNLVGLFGNLGMYSFGVPIGMFVDSRGPRPAVLAGAVLLALGYFPLHEAYDKGSGSVAVLCFFSYLSGLGGCMAFAAAVKTSALNWPQHRGTATAFPLAAFGLSAFFFSFFGSVVFPGDPSAFLMLLACGTFSLTFGGFFFLKVHSSSAYHSLPHSEPGRGSFSQQLRRTSSGEAKAQRPAHHGSAYTEPGTSSISSATVGSYDASPSRAIDGPDNSPSAVDDDRDEESFVAEETSSLMSSPPVAQNVAATDIDADHSRRIDIRGVDLLRQLSFWQLFSIMAILAGVGIMTINNIGNNAKALWKHYDESVDENFLVNRQQMHVSTLSVCSFIGRLLSGVGSDVLVKTMHASRVWCLALAGSIFLVAQICGLSIENPHLLIFVSGLSGLAYGLLFGVFPSIVAETFGIRGLSQNWGFMTLAPVISSNLFNLFYGKILDSHSVIDPDKKRMCHEGLNCYRAAYGVTFSACVLGLFVTLWVIRHQKAQRLKETRKTSGQD